MGERTIKEGDPIAYTTDNLGVTDPETRRVLSDVVVNDGDRGRYVRPVTGEPDWHVTDVVVDGRACIVMVHTGHFRREPK